MANITNVQELYDYAMEQGLKKQALKILSDNSIKVDKSGKCQETSANASSSRAYTALRRLVDGLSESLNEAKAPLYKVSNVAISGNAKEAKKEWKEEYGLNFKVVPDGRFDIYETVTIIGTEEDLIELLEYEEDLFDEEEIEPVAGGQSSSAAKRQAKIEYYKKACAYLRDSGYVVNISGIKWRSYIGYPIPEGLPNEMVIKMSDLADTIDYYIEELRYNPDFADLIRNAVESYAGENYRAYPDWEDDNVDDIVKKVKTAINESLNKTNKLTLNEVKYPEGDTIGYRLKFYTDTDGYNLDHEDGDWASFDTAFNEALDEIKSFKKYGTDIELIEIVKIITDEYITDDGDEDDYMEEEELLRSIPYDHKKYGWKMMSHLPSENHTSYVIHQIMDWGRDYTDHDTFRSIKKIADACERYDNEYTADEYEFVIRNSGLLSKATKNSRYRWNESLDKSNKLILNEDLFEDFSSKRQKMMSLPEAENIKKICEYKGWMKPVYVDKTVNGYRCNWNGTPFVKALGGIKEAEKVIDDIKAHLGIKCQLTKQGNLIIPFSKMNESLKEDLTLAPQEDALEGPQTEEEVGVSHLILDAISCVTEMISMYNDITANTNDEEIIEVINQITEDNNKHMGMLQGILTNVSPNAEAIQDGVEEVKEETVEAEPVEESFEETDEDKIKRLKNRLQVIVKDIENGEDPEHLAYEKNRIMDELHELGCDDGWFDESLTEDLHSKFKREIKNAYKQWAAEVEKVEQQRKEATYMIPDDADEEMVQKFTNDYIPKIFPMPDDFKFEFPHNIEKNDFPFYVTYYAEYPIFEPAEGGYYYPGRDAIWSEGFETKEEAEQFLDNFVREDGEDWEKYTDGYLLRGRYIGEDQMAVIEANNEYLMQVAGYEPYQ